MFGGTYPKLWKRLSDQLSNVKDVTKQTTTNASVMQHSTWIRGCLGRKEALEARASNQRTSEDGEDNIDATEASEAVKA